MAFRHCRISTLARIDAMAARAEILDALRTASMHRGTAALALDMSVRGLVRLIDDLGMAGEVAELDEKARAEGWHHGRLGGRTPRSATR